MSRIIKTVAHNNYDGTWRIETSHGDEILIDEEDLDLVMRYSFSVNGRGYAHAHINGKCITIQRYILGITDPDVTIDHINGDKLDNRRANLRVCTRQQNCCNRGIGSNNRSGCTGVSMRKNGKFIARIVHAGKENWLGTFATFDEAVNARIAGEIEHFGIYRRDAMITCGSVN